MSTRVIGRSVCPYCAVGCGLILESEDGRLAKVRGDRTHPANFGALCQKGALLAEAVNARGRASVPLLRQSRDEPFQRVTWEKAVAFVATRLREIIATHGAQSIALYGSGQLHTEDYYLLGKLAKGFLRTNNQDTNSRLCMASASAAYTLALGADAPPCSYEDLDEARCFLIVGANPHDCHPVLFQRMRARKRQRPDEVTVIVVDPRRTATASLADLHLPIRPGTDVPLLLAMLHEVVRANVVDWAFVRRYTENWGAVALAAEAWPPERAAEECGVPASLIRAAARAFATSRASVALWGMGLNQSRDGVQKNLALINLCLATGNIGRRGSGPFSLTGQANAMGGREAGGMAHTLPGHRLVANPDHRAEVERFWGLPPGTISPARGLTAAEIFRAAAAGELQALWVICTNPGASMPNLTLARAALARVPLLVVQDAYHPTETSEFAHVVLPAAQWSEREGTMTNSERRVCLLERVADPPGEALPDWQIFCRVARALGFESSFRYSSSEEIFREFVATTAGRDLDMSGLTYDLLRARGGIQWPCPKGAQRGTRRLFVLGRFPTESGRARFLPPVYERRPAGTTNEGLVLLVTGRLREHWHTRTRTGKVAKLVRAAPEPYVALHPEDARRLGLAEGHWAEIRSPRGRAVLPVRLEPGIAPGTAFAPFHWGPSAGGDGAVNVLTSDEVDPLSGEPDIKYCEVLVRPWRSRPSRTP